MDTPKWFKYREGGICRTCSKIRTVNAGDQCVECFDADFIKGYTEQGAPEPDTELALEAELSKAKELIKEFTAVCKLVHEDCEMALADTWDRSDDGFEAMRDNMSGLIEKARAQGAKS